MRASLFLVAGLVLAACSSSTPSPSVNPQTPSALNRLSPADEFHLALRFKNITPNSTLHFDAGDFECTAAQPEKIDLKGDQTATVVITAHDKGHLCFDRDHYLYFYMDFRGEKRSFDGYLTVYSTPPDYDWRARLNRGAREHGLCTIPDGFDHGRQIHEDELIEFSLCG